MTALVKEKCIECGEDFGVDPDTGQAYADPEGKEEIGDEFFLNDDDQDDMMPFDLQGKGGSACPYCVERAFTENDTVVVIGPDGKEVLHWDGRIAYFEDGDGIDEYREIAKGIARGAKWLSTDVWRGYTGVPDKAHKLVLALSGWHSSMEGSDLSERINSLTKGDLNLGYPVAVVFSRTSNVCSIGLDVYAPEDKVEEIKKLLDETPAPKYAGF